MASLPEKLGQERWLEINALHRQKKITAINFHGAEASEPGACLILSDVSRLMLDLDYEETKHLVGYLGFFGKGEDGLDTPAFLHKPAA